MIHPKNSEILSELKILGFPMARIRFRNADGDGHLNADLGDDLYTIDWSDDSESWWVDCRSYGDADIGDTDALVQFMCETLVRAEQDNPSIVRND